jgi:hypothetical protein
MDDEIGEDGPCSAATGTLNADSRAELRLRFEFLLIALSRLTDDLQAILMRLDSKASVEDDAASD